jgi:Mg/Co/Ni transporter MgtE
VIVLVTFTVGLVIWVAGWAFGLKAFDVFMLTVLMTVIAAAVRITIPYLNQFLGRDPAYSGDSMGPPGAPGS